jgi:hypothetical protein
MELPNPIKNLLGLKISSHRRVWKPFMEKYKCQKIAEVGVFRGENFMWMIEHNPEVAVAIDSWTNDGITANDAKLSQERLDEQYECFRAMTMSKSFVEIKRGQTYEISKEYEDNYFDLIYIDADHGYEGCKRDLEAWYPKCQRFFIGDDYNKQGVRKAVDEFAKNNNLQVYPLTKNGWAILK